jgi:hypothetical protein
LRRTNGEPGFKPPWIPARLFQPLEGYEMTINAHIDRQKNKTIDGVTFTNTHSGQRKAYGDSFYDYTVTSDLPADEVERVCREKVYKADLTKAKWTEEYRAKPSADNYFRAHYEFKKRPDGRYFYSVCFPYAD